MRSNQWRSTPARSFAVRAAQEGRARAAAAIALRVSSVPMFGMWPNAVAVAGLCTVSVAPFAADAQRPSMKHCSRNSRGSFSFIRGEFNLRVDRQDRYCVQAQAGRFARDMNHKRLGKESSQVLDCGILQRSKMAVTPMPPAVQMEIKPRLALFSSR